MVFDGSSDTGLRIDDVDLGILYLLQENARSKTVNGIGESVGVSASTVGNRINRMEEAGIITGYHPTIDYGKVGFDQHLLVTGTVPFEDLESAGDAMLDVRGVTNVRELLTNEQNVSLEIVAENRREVERMISSLNSLGVNIERIQMVRRERDQPVDQYGKEATDEEESE
jgi:DNA-binding Lrp family transcriptional regulator